MIRYGIVLYIHHPTTIPYDLLETRTKLTLKKMYELTKTRQHESNIITKFKLFNVRSSVSLLDLLLSQIKTLILQPESYHDF